MTQRGPATFSVCILLFFFAFFAFLPGESDAAMLYFDPSEGEYAPGDTFSAKIRIDSEGECVNALSARLQFPTALVKVADIARGDSILTLWTETPKVNQVSGTVSFSGGIPGGYCGRVDGDPGLSNVIAEVIFQVPPQKILKDKPVVEVSFLPETEVLLNDGFGTPAALQTFPTKFTIGESKGLINDKWLQFLKADTVPPQSFGIELAKDRFAFAGRYFIVFSTTDKESGIDHYEVQESDIKRDGYRKGSNKRALWKEVGSPYPLEDQTLNSIIKVKAIDKAGNERIAAYIPDESIREKTSGALAFGVLTANTLVFVGIFFSVRQRILRRKRETKLT